MIASSMYPAFSRNFDDEQDYADAAAAATRRASPLLRNLPPVLRWKKKIRRDSATSNAAQQQAEEQHPLVLPVKVKTLIVGLQGGGASFARECFNPSEADWAGTLVLPGAALSELGDSLDPADPLNSACNIFFLRKDEADAGGEGGGNDGGGGDEGAGGGGGGVAIAVAMCGYPVPPSRAQAWARALLGGIDCEVVVCLGSVGIEPGRSRGWEGARLLATAEAEEREDCLKMSSGFQPLPTPTMLAGASAALVSYCQRHGRAAMCFAAAEWPGKPRQHLVERALGGTRKALGVLVGDDAMATAAGGGGVEGVEIADDSGSTSNLYV